LVKYLTLVGSNSSDSYSYSNTVTFTDCGIVHFSFMPIQKGFVGEKTEMWVSHKRSSSNFGGGVSR